MLENYATDRYLKFRLFSAFILSIFYASILCSLDLTLFKDLRNYELYVDTLEYRKELILKNGIIFFEPLFYLICKILNLFFDSEGVVRFFIFFNSFTVFYKCSTRFDKRWQSTLLLLLCLLQPQVFALQLVTVRQGFGAAIFLWLFPVLKNKLQLALTLAILGMIHNSFFIIAFFVFIFYLFERVINRSYYWKIFLLFLAGIVFNLAIFVVLQFFSSKQGAGYEEASLQGGGGGFILWGALFFYICVLLRKWRDVATLYETFDFALIGLIIYLTSYFLTPIAGRIIGTFIPFIYFIVLLRKENWAFGVLLLLLNWYLFFNGGAEAFLETDLPTLMNDIEQVVF